MARLRQIVRWSGAACALLICSAFVSLPSLQAQGEGGGATSDDTQVEPTGATNSPQTLAGPNGTEEIRASLTKVLAQPEFTVDETPGAFGQMVNAVVSWLLRLNADWLGTQEMKTLSSVSEVIMWIVLITSVAFIIYRTVRFWQGRLNGVSPRKADGVSSSGAVRESLDDIKSALDEATAQGEWARVLRLAWRFALLRCEERGLLEPDHTLTNWECLRRLARVDQTAASDLRTVVRAYDRHVFGGRPLAAEDCTQLREVLDRATSRLLSGGIT